MTQIRIFGCLMGALCLAGAFPATAGLFGSGGVVRRLPANFENPTLQTLAPGKGHNATPWVVFSDRVDNYTYTSPGGTLVYKKTAYMQPFYVAEVKDGYLRLVQYDAGLLSGLRIKDRKRAVSYGWISQDRMLLWRKALMDPQTLFPLKAIVVITGRDPLAQPRFFFNDDSAWVYSSPDLQEKMDRKIRLDQFVYIYKRSEDGKKFLVGRSPQVTADSTSGPVLGWVSEEVIHPWGSRLYLGLARGNDDSADSAAAAYAEHLVRPVSGRIPPLRLYDPLLSPIDPTLRSFPVMERERAGAPAGFTSGVAGDVFDKSRNSVINIKGTRLEYPAYLRLRKYSNRVNVLFVVDGGSPMKDYLPGLSNSIQGFEGVFLQKKLSAYRYHYGAVVYRSLQGCGSGAKDINTFPLNDNFSKALDFLNAQASVTSKCSGNIYEQPVYKGLEAALGLLEGHAMETNLIILCGSTGDFSTMPSASQLGLIRGMVETDARMLVLQVYNKYDASFNNFVLQTRDLLEKAAQLQADNKKLRMVKGEGLAATQQFNTAYTDSVSYYLNYPDASLIPGAIVFPARGMVKTNREMSAALNRFLSEVDADNTDVIKSLDSAFRETGRLRERLNDPVVADLLQQDSVPIPDHLGEALPNNTFKYYIDVHVPGTMTARGAPWQYALIVSQEEMLQLSDQLSRLAGDNLQQDKNNFRRQLFRSYLATGRSVWRRRYRRGAIKHMTLSGYLETLTGMPLPDPFLENHTVVSIKRSDMSREEFEVLVRYLRECNQALKKQLQMDDFFVANGIPYYYILQQDWAMNGGKKGALILPAAGKKEKAKPNNIMDDSDY